MFYMKFISWQQESIIKFLIYRYFKTNILFFLSFHFRHLVFAPSTYDAYAGATFPGLVDLMYEIDLAEDSEERWEEVRKHLATIIFAINSANTVLKPHHLPI